MKNLLLLSLCFFASIESKIETVTISEVPTYNSFVRAAEHIPLVGDFYMKRMYLLQVRHFYTHSIFFNTLFDIQSEEDALHYVRTAMLPFLMLAENQTDENSQATLKLVDSVMVHWKFAHTNSEIRKCFKETTDGFEPVYNAIENMSVLESWKNGSNFKDVAMKTARDHQKKCMECSLLLDSYMRTKKLNEDVKLELEKTL